MSAPGTPKASKAAVAAVQDALDAHWMFARSGGSDFLCGNDDCREWMSRAEFTRHVARAAADAVAPHIAAQTLRDGYRELRDAGWDVRTHGDAYAILLARADRIEAT